MPYQHNPLGLEPFDDSEPWYLFSLDEPAPGPSGARWFGPSGDCGCCNGFYCDGQLVEAVSLAIFSMGGGSDVCCDMFYGTYVLDQDPLDLYRWFLSPTAVSNTCGATNGEISIDITFSEPNAVTGTVMISYTKGSEYIEQIVDVTDSCFGPGFSNRYSGIGLCQVVSIALLINP